MKRLVIIPLLWFLAASCSTTDTVPTLPGTPMGVERITPEFGRSYTGLTDPIRTVVKDERSFEVLWNAAYAGRGDHPLPVVDFEKDMVIVVAMGEQSSGGYAITVSGVTVRAGQAVVDVVSTTPGRGCAVSLALTQPIDIVKAPKLRTLIQFEERLERADCD